MSTAEKQILINQLEILTALQGLKYNTDFENEFILKEELGKRIVQTKRILSEGSEDNE